MFHIRHRSSQTRHVFVRTVEAVLAQAVTYCLVGLEPRRVEVEAHLQRAVPAFAIVGLDVVPVRHLAEAVAYLRGERDPPPYVASNGHHPVAAALDLADVLGQERPRRALELAGAGGHNLLLAGPPGTGKTMLGRRIPTVLPEMTRGEALETTKIYSAVGLADGLIDARPFRAPHHTISPAALIGGGSTPRPG